MNNRKNGAISHEQSKNIRQVVALIAPLYFFSLFIAGLILALVFK